MSIGYTIFFACLAAYLLMLVISFWTDKLGGYLSLAALALVFLVSAIVIFLFLTFAPKNIQTIALYIGIGIIVLTLIVNLLSQA